MISLVFKVAYDIGYFKAQSLVNDKNAAKASVRAVLSMEAAQKIVTGALKEDPANPKTTVYQVVDNNPDISTIIVVNNNQKKVAWIVDMRLFFVGDFFNANGYNLTEAVENQYNIVSRN